MKKLNVVMCSWKSPKMLEACVDSLLDSFTVDASIKVVLNEGDKESAQILCDRNIDFVRVGHNSGTLGVDYVANQLDAEFWVNSNDDMYYHKGWDSDLISIIEERYPCSASCFLIEPFDGPVHPNPVCLPDNLGEFTDPETKRRFLENYANGKYKMPKKKISYTHPIMVKTEDYFAVNGYSNGFDQAYYPGYALDDDFPWRLWIRHQGRFNFITSNKSCVYHGVSLTNSKLAPEIKSRSGWDSFIRSTGMTIADFKNHINCFSEID